MFLLRKMPLNKTLPGGYFLLCSKRDCDLFLQLCHLFQKNFIRDYRLKSHLVLLLLHIQNRWVRFCLHIYSVNLMLKIIGYNLIVFFLKEIYCWRNVKIEEEVQFVQKAIHSIRSARSDYNLPNKAKTESKL